MENLQSIFSPESIAVIGASRKEGAVGREVFSNILKGGYTGKLFPVNPKTEDVLGVKCYPDIKSVPETVDLVVIVVPSPIIPKILNDCGQKGVKGVIIISAGFKEVGSKGVELEKEVINIVDKYGMVMVGPNCLGIINTDPSVSLNASFGKHMPSAGNISFISQSGALCTAILDYARSEGVGFSKFISFGNKAHLNEIDFVSYLNEDPQTKVILIYVEDLTDTREFMKVARSITAGGKPIIAIKSGRTSQGAKAALSHTGALAGADEIYDALFQQSGVIRVDSLEELFATASAFANSPVPGGRRIAIITNAGGPGVMATDASIKCGLELAKFEDSTVEELKKHLPKTASLNNPVDLIGDARHDKYEHAVNNVLKDKNVDGVIVLLTPQAMTDVEEIARVLVKAAKGGLKPVLCSFMGASDVSGGVEILESGNIPHYKFPEKAAKALGDMNSYREWGARPRTEVKSFSVDREKASQVLSRAKQEGRIFLPEIEVLKVLNAYGFPVLKSRLCTGSDECLKAACDVGYPVAMKIVSPDIIHKFETGGVILGLAEDLEVKKAYEEMMGNIRKNMPRAKIWGVNIQQMAEKGQEVILGARRDELFGPVVMFGVGGIYTEVIKDVAFGFAPLGSSGAIKMIKSVKMYKILAGARGQLPADISAIGENLMRLSQLIMDFDEVSELDINPLIVYPEGCKVVDARIITK